MGVAHLPEPVSPMYRNCVRKVSPMHRSQGVVYLPRLHSSGPEFLERKMGFEPATLTLAIRSPEGLYQGRYQSLQVTKSRWSVWVHTVRPNPVR
jgi:hypothetical protein